MYTSASIMRVICIPQVLVTKHKTIFSIIIFNLKTKKFKSLCFLHRTAVKNASLWKQASCYTIRNFPFEYVFEYIPQGSSPCISQMLRICVHYHRTQKLAWNATFASHGFSIKSCLYGTVSWYFWLFEGHTSQRDIQWYNWLKCTADFRKCRHFGRYFEGAAKCF